MAILIQRRRTPLVETDPTAPKQCIPAERKIRIIKPAQKQADLTARIVEAQADPTIKVLRGPMARFIQTKQDALRMLGGTE